MILRQTGHKTLQAWAWTKYLSGMNQSDSFIVFIDNDRYSLVLRYINDSVILLESGKAA